MRPALYLYEGKLSNEIPHEAAKEEGRAFELAKKEGKCTLPWTKDFSFVETELSTN